MGGRRFLSDDVATLDTIAVAVARRIDAIRLTRERYQREIHEQEIGKLASEAELRALRAQVNPHFLFNALTTIGYLIQTAPPRAVQTLMRLTSLLRAVLRSEGEFTTLGRELDLVESYLDIERERFEHRLRVIIDVPVELRQIRVPPLVLQPLVENAVKHGIAPTPIGRRAVRVARPMDAADDDAPSHFDHRSRYGSGRERNRPRAWTRNRRRVAQRRASSGGACTGRPLRSTIQSAAGKGTTVEIRVPTSLDCARRCRAQTR